MNNNVFHNLPRQMPSLQSLGVIQANKENEETISISINTIGLKLMFEVVSIKYFIVSRLWTIQLNTCKMFWKISHSETFLLAFLYVYCVGTQALLLSPPKPHAYMHMCDSAVSSFYSKRRCFGIQEEVLGILAEPGGAGDAVGDGEEGSATTGRERWEHLIMIKVMAPLLDVDVLPNKRYTSFMPSLEDQGQFEIIWD